MSERYAIFGDVHGNWEAFDAVLEDAQNQGVTRYISVGDIVGYNADPVKCLERVMEMECESVLGNHDQYCTGNSALNDFHPLAAEVIRWTRGELSDEQTKFLGTRALVKRVGGFTVVHSTLDMPEKWGYVFDTLEAAANFSYQSTQLCFHGHTHVPVVFERQKDVTRSRYTRVKLAVGTRYFINVGSVGQPRDGDPRAAYCIYDPSAKLVELRRIRYDIGATQKKIRKAGLPDRLARRLEFGK